MAATELLPSMNRPPHCTRCLETGLAVRERWLVGFLQTKRPHAGHEHHEGREEAQLEVLTAGMYPCRLTTRLGAHLRGMTTSLLLLLLSVATAQSGEAVDQEASGSVVVGLYRRGGFTEREWNASVDLDEHALRLLATIPGSEPADLPFRLPEAGDPSGVRPTSMALVGPAGERWRRYPHRSARCVFSGLRPGTYTVYIRPWNGRRITLRGVRVVPGHDLNLAVASTTGTDEDVVTMEQNEVVRAFRSVNPQPYLPESTRFAAPWSRDRPGITRRDVGCQTEIWELGHARRPLVPCPW